ncbi:MAG: ketopantoate reductase family protein [Candidatus Wukongarchaeota archaeon]|nr:2-dehydropantoate 2-reductase N-terminal domain-containing protein [Candidatus Wukongarchaeota archaeon]MDO8129222.1 2-dehydropantoate 2-reductase N-terminal domain-containing protein [Candidatus Wukongarchaeota archaeon]
MVSLNVTIFGAGAVGSMLGGVIIKHEGKAVVNLVGRKPHMEAVDRSGLTIEFGNRLFKRFYCFKRRRGWSSNRSKS